MTHELQDELHMRRALALAAETVALASPNPQVGCVLVSPTGEILGEGAHRYATYDHAEIVALKAAAAAGQSVAGATAYVTLEPCSHHGRTGPCADALIAAGIARCVIATVDPNPAVSGRGIAKLQAAGIATTVGVCQPEARSLNDAFAFAIQSCLGKPQVTYHETIRASAEGEGKYVRQTGGSGNYGHVKIRISPNAPGEGYEFSSDITPSTIPSRYIQPIEEGIQEAMRGGVLAGHKMIDIRVSLNGGSCHDVDSNEMAFRIAGSMAFKEAARKAKPVLLEVVGIQEGRPFITLKAALSVDGKLAPAEGRTPGQPHWLTGPEARAEVQRLRHASDAILTGIGTVLADDPSLTDRTGLPRRRPLLRVILDTSLRTSPASQLIKTARTNSFAEPDLLLVCSQYAPADREQTLRDAANERLEILRLPIEEIPADVNLKEILAELARRKYISVLLEAGSALNGAFLAADLVDRAVLFYAQTELGPDALPFAQGQPSPYLLQQRLIRPTHTTFGPTDRPDACITGLLHDPWPTT